VKFVLKPKVPTLGQTVAVSNPYFSGTPVYAFSQYDARGRPKLQTAADGTKTAYGYDGLSLSVTNNFGATDGTPESRNQVVSTLKNAKGETVSVTTYLNTTPLTVSYLHDPVGNLIQTTDHNNNIIQMHYDIRGNKTWQSDPDMGVWSYHYNALDELVDQTNANLQVTSMEYDLLGRMVKRIAPEGTAQWVFDNSGEGGKLGALWREELTDGTNLVQRKTYAYDAFKRPMLELMNHDGKWFYTTFRYDDRSRLHYTDWFWRSQAVIDSGNNLSPDWNRFSMEYIYDDASGFLIAVKDGTGHQWWSCALSDYDEQGRIIGFEQGNGVETAIHFNPQTGHIEEINFSNLGAGSADYEFEYDRLGGLTQRTLSRTSQSMLSETCTYDSLNRLQTTTVGGVTASTTYDVLGNIKTKTGIAGIYVYGSSRPHAVTAANGVSYGYDNGGNMISRTEGTNTSTIAWTSFNKPTRIERGANASEFTYDANHQRITQLTDSAGTLQKKIYIGNRMEQEEAPNGQGGWTNTLTRIFVSTPAGVIGIEERTPAQTTRQYLHRDPLGSIVAVSGEAQSGNAPLLAEYAYDAWGKRRNSSNWSPTTTNPANPTTDRGFTGHEMLDHIDLIHMNGRIYDPLIGRFLSPDPQIQAPENLQSFNRYTYVLNRPLSLTDPSGFTAEGNGLFQLSSPSNHAFSTQNIIAIPLSSYDNVGGNFMEITVWTTDWWTDEDNELQFTMYFETVIVEVAPPPAVVESAGGGEGNTVSSVGMWSRFLSTVDNVGWKLESWADNNRAQTAKSYAQYEASYQEYMTNPKYKDVRTFEEAVGKKIKVGMAIYGGYKAISMLVPAPKTTTGGGRTVSLYHQGNLQGGKVSTTKGLWTSKSSNLNHYRPDGKLNQFKIPEKTYYQWRSDGLVLPGSDTMKGIVTPAEKIMPPASGWLNDFLVPPGG